MTSLPRLHLHDVRHGVGHPLLALHGAGVDHRLMSGFLEPVAARHGGLLRLYPDLPGMGSSPGEGVSSSQDVLDAVDAYVGDVIGGEPFTLIGESFGGYIARALARRRFEQVLGLALVCPIGTQALAHERHLPRHEVRRTDDAFWEGLRTTDPAAAETFAELAVVRDQPTHARFVGEIAPGLGAGDPEAQARIAAAYALPESPEDGPVLDVPTLIITGRQDASVGYLDQFALLGHYPHATFAVLDTAGHNAQIERPEVVAALVEDWLERVAAEAGWTDSAAGAPQRS
jgi:Predicted hydrolases or acyltransferases (alpha/beta hydrolase superfamily)